jgi:CRP/FNR family transcriptional regulator, cyclic AMP receptor protein
MVIMNTSERPGIATYEVTPAPGVKSDLMQWLPPAVQDAFRGASRRRRLDAGEFLFQHGEAGREMYRVLSGTLRLSLMREDGQQMIYALMGPGECIAASSLIDGHPLPQTADALDEVHLQVLSAAAFARLREEHRAFDDALLHLFAARLRVFSQQLATARLADLPSQVVLRLLELAKPDAHGRLAANVIHSDLAMFVGASRQSIHRVLKSLTEESLIALHYGSIELLDLDRLKAKADFL